MKIKPNEETSENPGAKTEKTTQDGLEATPKTDENQEKEPIMILDVVEPGPDGLPIQKKLPIYSAKELKDKAQQGHRFAQNMGELNKLKAEVEALRKQLSEGDKTQQNIYADLKKELDELGAGVDLSKIAEGDVDGVAKALESFNKRLTKVQDILIDQQEIKAEEDRMYNEYNTEIDKAVKEYPNLDAKEFVALIKETGIAPNKVMALASRVAGQLSKTKTETLTPEQEEAIKQKIREDLEAPSPPPSGGTKPPGTKKEEVIVPKTVEELLDEADKLREKFQEE